MCVCVCVYIYIYIYCCAFVGLYKMHGTYIEIVLMVFAYQLIIRKQRDVELKKNPAHVFPFNLSENHLNFFCSFTSRSPKRSFTSDFSNRTLYELLLSVIRTTLPAYLIICDEECFSWCLFLCSVLHLPVTYNLLGPNTEWATKK